MGKMRKLMNLVMFGLVLWSLVGETTMAKAQNATVEVKVGVVLDLETWVGQMGLSCINMALSDFYASHHYYKTRLRLVTRDSMSDVVGAASSALDLIKNEKVQAIIGPVTSMQANFIIELGYKAQVPITTFSASSPSLSSLRSPYFFRAAMNDSSQVQAISAIVKAFGWRQAVPIYVDNEFGEGVIPYLTDALQEVDARVPYRSVIPPSATDDQIVKELYNLMTMQTRVFIVHMLPPLGARLFAKAKEIGMMNEGYVWIMTTGITNLFSLLNPSVIDSMQGVLGVKSYVPRSKEREDFRVRWKRKFQQDYPTVIDVELTINGLWAYDATVALAMATEKVGTNNFGFDKTNSASNSRTDLNSFGVSRNGPKIREALAGTSFKGLTGDFSFIDGKLQSSTFQIINVNGNGEKGIGFWTPKDGLVKELSSATNTSSYSTSKGNLGTILWPGDSTSVPKGWEIPTKGKRLKIVVPVKDGFSEFVKVAKDPSTNTTKVTGYCIDVFEAVIKALPYDVSYDFFPFALPNGSAAGSYNDMIDQVYYGNYDVVVGDTTIVANRSQYVDFTLPYTESGVSMIVPIKNNDRKNAWVFLKPLTWDLWLTSACSFVFIGFVVWILEHRINEDFRGPPLHQVGTSFWFSFSTMVFAHRERVVSNLARFVVIIWCFVVLILTQSYTASLTSLLTVQQLQPTVTDVKELLKRGENVGYQDGSFVFHILKQLKFDDTKLKPYGSPEECDELFAKGSANGGISAVLDEIPYMRLFLARYCSKYTIIEPKFKTDGFGFVFPKDSPLVPDVSRAVLTVTQGKKMTEIEDAWFKKETTCPEPNTLVSSNSLGLDSFWGLFVIAASAALFALMMFGVMFLFENRHVLKDFDPRVPLWRRVLVLLRIFDQKDLSSHTFRKSDLHDRSGTNSVLGNGTTETSPNTHCPPSPSSYSHHTDSFAFCEEQGTPSREFSYPFPFSQESLENMSTVELTEPNEEGPRTLQVCP